MSNQKVTDSVTSDWKINNDSLHKFISSQKSKKWLTVTFRIDSIDPLAYIEQKTGEDQLYYWEQPKNQFSIASGGAVTILKATGSSRFSEIGKQSRSLHSKIAVYSEIEHTLAAPLLFGGYSFFDHNVEQNWKSFGAARFVLPSWSIIKNGKFTLLTLTVPLANKNADTVIRDLYSDYKNFIDIGKKIENYRFTSADKKSLLPFQKKGSTFEKWQSQVEQARKLIQDNFFQKIVIARELTVESEKPIQVTHAMHHLRKRFPGCYTFMVQVDGNKQFFGATPERLVSLQRNTMHTESLAGSISRGDNATEDAALEHLLLKSNKDRSEHDFVVRDIRDNLKPYSFRIEHPEQPEVKKLDNVQHLYTPIRAKVKKNITIHELTGRLHPTPAVGGYPREDAVPYIHEIEKINRGWYAGPVGWFNLEGSGEFAVAIRSALVEGRKARLFAGCGIVKNSDPAREWSETELKLQPVLNALKKSTFQKDND